MRCQKAESLLVAAADGEIASRDRRALDRHLAGCMRCRAAEASTEGMLAALDELAPEAVVSAGLEQRVLRQVRALAADEAAHGVGGMLWERIRTLAPMLTAAGVVVVAFIGVRGMQVPGAGPAVVAETSPVAEAPKRTVVGRRPKVRIPEVPPAELASQADLFVDLPLLRDLDKLRHFDAIAGMEGEGATVGPETEGRSNG